jgi:hypothetical protein
MSQYVNPFASIAHSLLPHMLQLLALLAMVPRF